MRKLCVLAAAALCTAAAIASPTHRGATPYLQDQTLDVSTDFLDFANVYFFADSLAQFDTATGSGLIEWKRHQLMPRQAFNANTFLHQPLQQIDFPDTAYPNDPELSFTITTIDERTLRLHIYTTPKPAPGDDEQSPMLVSPLPDDKSSWTVSREGKNVIYQSPYGQLQMDAYPWRITLRDGKGKLMTQTRVWSDNDSTQVKVPPFSFIKRGSNNSRSINPVFSLMPGEKIYGFGESATSLDKVGQKINLFVCDPQGPETPDMYKPVPFFMSNRGYGMFLHTSAPVTADVGASYIGANKLYMADEELDLFIFFGEPKEVASAYTQITGRPEMPPLWSFGTWMSRISYFTEDEGREVAAALRKHQIPADVIHFDTGWFDVDWQCDYEFSPERFKDPAKMISDLKKDGFHICLWQLPYFVPGNKYFNELVDNKLSVRNGKGGMAYEDAVLDFTNPATVEWYQGKLAGLLNMGVGAIKVDFGEAAPLDGVYHNGRSGLYEHNIYPLRYNKAVSDITKQIGGERIMWARSAWAGSQRYPLHWGGDAATNATGFLGTIHAGLSLGLSGFSFWSHDMGGFVSSTPEELYRRWLPIGFLTSHTRAHGAPPTEPWLYENPDFLDYFRRCAEMKYQLMPYVYSQATESATNGWPMFRALLMEFPEDPGAWLVDNQYMFGAEMLVAPLLEPGTSRDVYLPGKDKWVDYQTGEVYTPGWQHINVPDDALQAVIFVRDGARIPHVKVAQRTDQIDWDNIEWRSYGDGAERPFNLVIPK